MPRKSPRSRKRPDATPRMPGKNRPRATPGRTRSAARAAAVRDAKTAHASKGARGTAVPREPSPRSRRVSRTRGRRFPAPDPARVAAVLGILERTYPDARTALDFQSALQLLVATILSAQCTDARVNQVTPGLFARWPDAAALAAAPRDELEEAIKPTGFFRNKAKAIQSCCHDILAKHGGEVPNTMEALTLLHGVGRKTANVVLGHALGVPGLPVDRHVLRVSNRIGIAEGEDPEKVEAQLCAALPKAMWTLASDVQILHGRRVCRPKPLCDECSVRTDCDYYHHVITKERGQGPAKAGRNNPKAAKAPRPTSVGAHVRPPKQVRAVGRTLLGPAKRRRS